MNGDIDQLDVAILKALKNNPRGSLREIANKVGIAVGTVQNRMKKLENKKILLGFYPEIDYNKLGYDFDVIIAVRVRREKIDELKKLLNKEIHVRSVYEVTGGYDMFVRAQFESNEQLRDFLIKNLKDELVKESVTYVILNKTYKHELV